MNNLFILILFIFAIIVLDIILFYRLFKKEKSKVDRRLIGYCSVDAGMILITDPCYVKHFDNSLKDVEIDGFGYKVRMVDLDKMDQEEEKEKKSYSYAGCCVVVDGKDRGGQLYNGSGVKMGVCASSGVGDGVYPVYAIYNSRNEVEAIIVDFNDLIDGE